MKYEPVYFSKYNISTACTDAKTAVADWLLFVDDNAVLAEDAIPQLEKYVAQADEKTVLFELRQTPVDTARHTDSLC